MQLSRTYDFTLTIHDKTMGEVVFKEIGPIDDLDRIVLQAIDEVEEYDEQVKEAFGEDGVVEEIPLSQINENEEDPYNSGPFEEDDEIDFIKTRKELKKLDNEIKSIKVKKHSYERQAIAAEAK